MLIKGQNLDRPVILGRVKLGDKGGKNGAPRKFNEFRLYKGTKDDQGQPVADEDLQKEMYEKYGKPLVRIPIFLMYGSLEANFDSRFSWFRRVEGQALPVCFGDGETGHRAINSNGSVVRNVQGEIAREEMRCPCDKFSRSPDADRKICPCKISGKLMFQLADYPMGGGVYILRTHSYHSVHRLSWALQQMNQITMGNMGGIPVDLVLEKQRTSRNQEIFVARIEWAFAASQLQLKAIETVKQDAEFRQMIADGEAHARITLSKLDEVEAEDITDEFYPDKDEPKRIEVEEPVAQEPKAHTEPPTAPERDGAEDELSAMTGGASETTQAPHDEQKPEPKPVSTHAEITAAWKAAGSPGRLKDIKTSLGVGSSLDQAIKKAIYIKDNQPKESGEKTPPPKTDPDPEEEEPTNESSGDDYDLF